MALAGQYPHGYPTESGFTLPELNNSSFSPEMVTANIVDNHSPVNRRTMINSHGYQISLVQNFVNSTYLGRQGYPVNSGFINYLIAIDIFVGNNEYIDGDLVFKETSNIYFKNGTTSKTTYDYFGIDFEQFGSNHTYKINSNSLLELDSINTLSLIANNASKITMDPSSDISLSPGSNKPVIIKDKGIYASGNIEHVLDADQIYISTPDLNVVSNDADMSLTALDISGTTANFNSTTNNIGGTTTNIGSTTSTNISSTTTTITGTTTNLNANTNNIGGTTTNIDSTTETNLSSPTTNINGASLNISSQTVSIDSNNITFDGAKFTVNSDETIINSAITKINGDIMQDTLKSLCYYDAHYGVSTCYSRNGIEFQAAPGLSNYKIESDATLDIKANGGPIYMVSASGAPLDYTGYGIIADGCDTHVFTADTIIIESNYFNLNGAGLKLFDSEQIVIHNNHYGSNTIYDRAGIEFEADGDNTFYHISSNANMTIYAGGTINIEHIGTLTMSGVAPTYIYADNAPITLSTDMGSGGAPITLDAGSAFLEFNAENISLGNYTFVINDSSGKIKIKNGTYDDMIIGNTSLECRQDLLIISDSDIELSAMGDISFSHDGIFSVATSAPIQLYSDVMIQLKAGGSAIYESVTFTSDGSTPLPSGEYLMFKKS